MKVALFIPCYVDAIYPNIGIATLELLEKLGIEVIVPPRQTCCGQPMANEGDLKHSEKTERHFCETFEGYDTVVCPAGSCVHHVRDLMDSIEQTDNVQHIRRNTFELTEFIHDVLKITNFPWAKFPYTITIHNSCSSIRHVHLASMTEWQMPRFNKTETLLSGIEGLTIKNLDRPDECCGFGGTFCATDPGVAAKMGHDKIEDINRQDVEYLVTPDSSCMMHLSGLSERDKNPLKFIHLAQVLNNGPY